MTLMQLRRILFFAISANFFIVPQLQAQDSEDMGLQTLWDEIAREYISVAGQQNVVGGAIAWAKDGQLMDLRSFGLANRETGQLVDENTLFHWASVTKTLTSTAIMQLVERGLITLDDKIVDYLPELKAVHNPYGSMEDITLFHLMSHTSGFRALTWPWDEGPESEDYEWQPHEPTEWSQLVAMMPYTKIHFEPGSQYGYSNPGYIFLGRVVEVVTGEHIEEYLEKNILRPLGMTRSYFDITPWYLREHRSKSYYFTKEKTYDWGPEFDTGITVSNGGLNGPIGDLLKMGSFYAGAGEDWLYEKVLSRESLAEMATYVVDQERRESRGRAIGSRGLGFFLLTGEGEDSPIFSSHAGGQLGFISLMVFDPVSKTVVVSVANTAVADDLVSPGEGYFRRNIENFVLRFLPMAHATAEEAQ